MPSETVRTRTRMRPGPLNKDGERAPLNDSLTAQRIHLPSPPTISRAEDMQLNDEQMVARVELMMLKGVRRVPILMSTLGIPTERACKRLIEKVHARWDITGGGKDITRYRGEQLARLDLIESELWVKWQNDNGGTTAEGRKLGVEVIVQKDKNPVMKMILEVQVQRMELLGLSQRVIERLALMPNSANEVIARIQQQDALGTLATRFAELIAQRRQQLGHPTIDVSANVQAPVVIDDAETGSED